MDNAMLLIFVTVTIFSLIFAIGINSSHEQLTSLWREPALLLRSLLAAIVLVPLVVLLLLWLLDLPPGVAAGLSILAAAPGAPLMIKRSQMAGGDTTYAASLQMTLVMLAVLVTPLTLAVFYALFELPIERVSSFQVLLQVGEVTFLPVIAGLLIQLIACSYGGHPGNQPRVKTDAESGGAAPHRDSDHGGGRDRHRPLFGRPDPAAAFCSGYRLHCPQRWAGPFHCITV